MTYLCDTKVWLALLLSGHPHHRDAVGWFDDHVGPGEAVLCRPVEIALLRLLTSRIVLESMGRDPLTNDEARAVLLALLEDGRIVSSVDEPAGLDVLWLRMSARSTSSPKLWMDAFLASWALAAGWTMVTLDRAFSQFGGLDLVVIDASSV